ncbi:MAG: DUF1521 domain-containing protein [Deltaproteobacteria bacterium]|nr:DUF1521 domain-containing protein [Deltaproteobacteria bacterium]
MRLTQLPSANPALTTKPTDTAKPTDPTVKPGATGSTTPTSPGAITPRSLDTTPKTADAAKTAEVSKPGVASAQSNFEVNININININFGGAPGQQQGVLSSPSVDQAASPAGKGLEKNPEGFPEGSVRTAGGYTIVPEGKDAAFKVYGPNQSPSDEPMTRIWGDPHVSEKDGTKWDFTKDSNFRLPDGTTISVDTTSQTGQSVSQKLDIVNGDDHVAIDGINTNAPKTGDVVPGGQAWLEKNANTRDNFRLGDTGSHDDVKWFKEDAAGKVEGLITGATQDAEKSYIQTLDTTQKDVGGTGTAADQGAATGDRPALGSNEWKQQFEQMISELFSQMFSKMLSGTSQDEVRATNKTGAAKPAGAEQAAGAADGAVDTQPAADGNGMGGLNANGGENPLSSAIEAIQMLANLFQMLSGLMQNLGGKGGNVQLDAQADKA